MNTTRLFCALAFVTGMALTLATPAKAADVYKIDPVHSWAEFRIQHYGAGIVMGRFNDFSGTVTLDPKDQTKNSVQVEIQTKSVDTGTEKRDTHLRSKDFFDVEKYPVMSFKSTSFKKKSDTTYEVKGDFTLHGVTKPLTVEVRRTGVGKSPKGVELIGFQTTFTIKRSDFGMLTMLESNLVGDNVKITFSVECDKQ